MNFGNGLTEGVLVTKEETKDKIRDAWDLTKEIASDAWDEARTRHENELKQEVSEKEWTRALHCAAAALVDAHIADSKIVELLQKYFRIEAHEAKSALGEGHLIVEKKKNIAKARRKIESASKKQ